MIKDFVKARNEMLLKADVQALRDFVHERTDFYEKVYVDWFDCNEQLHEYTLHKMIISVPSLPQELREKSEKWLEEH